eukprot:gnl/Chilomastix_cuspidata/3190.p1 GENE.gnl/Chilomastix_cuspidata/3190~~gnl/Chilomastix_cuspidata/3190.p1  ORF type:complete len:231 (+),score=77.91 gnl/Chilomastix_cuspidata/3190:508-1200(+)
MDFFNNPFDDFFDDFPSSSFGFSRRRDDFEDHRPRRSYRVEELDNAHDHGHERRTTSAPRVEEPDDPRPPRPPRREPASRRRLSRGHGGFLSRFGIGDSFGMFDDISQHFSRMNEDFSRAFRDSERLARGDEAADAGDRGYVYCSSSSKTILPGGVEETRHAQRDSRTGLHTSVHTRRMGDRCVRETGERDMRTGVEERKRDLMNVAEADLAAFDADWEARGFRRRRALH